MGRINQLTPTTVVTTDSVIAVDAANGGVTNKLTINTLAGGLRVIGNYASQAQLAAKQDLLTFDDAPEEDSDNPVTSGGIYNAIGSAMSNVYTKAETDNAIAQSTAKYKVISGSTDSTGDISLSLNVQTSIPFAFLITGGNMPKTAGRVFMQGSGGSVWWVKFVSDSAITNIANTSVEGKVYYFDV